MAGVIKSSLSLNILTTEDSTQNVMVNRAAAPSLDNAFGDFISYYSCPSGAGPGATIFTKALPSGVGAGGPAFCAYVRNISNTASIQLTIKWETSLANQVQIIGPNGVWLVWNTITTGPQLNGFDNGINQVQVVASVAAAPIEFYFGG